MRTLIVISLIFIFSLNTSISQKSRIEQCAEAVFKIGGSDATIIVLDFTDISEDDYESFSNKVDEKTSNFDFSHFASGEFFLPESPIPIPFETNTTAGFDKSSRDNLLTHIKQNSKKYSRKKVNMIIPHTKEKTELFKACLEDKSKNYENMILDDVKGDYSKISFTLTNTNLYLPHETINEISTSDNLTLTTPKNKKGIKIKLGETLPFVFKNTDATKPSFIYITYNSPTKNTYLSFDPMNGNHFVLDKEIKRHSSYFDTIAGILINFKDVVGDDIVQCEITGSNVTWKDRENNKWYKRPEDMSMYPVTSRKNGRCFETTIQFDRVSSILKVNLIELDCVK